jgi:hypothetical protein
VGRGRRCRLSKSIVNLSFDFLLETTSFYDRDISLYQVHVDPCEQVLNQTGNEDLCYYNFLCAHPLGLLSGNLFVLDMLGTVCLTP